MDYSYSPTTTSFDSKGGIRYPLEDFPGFCELLMTRIFPIIDWVTNIDDHFIVFINLIDRNNAEQIKAQILRYGGVEVLKDLLGTHLQKQALDFLSANFQKLARYEIEFEESKEGGRLLEQFQAGDLGFEDINVGQLSDYFLKFFEEGKFANEGQEQEYPIINYFFDLEQDCYLSLPLIQFGHFDGVVHIIFKEKEKEKFANATIQTQLIKQISLEYEGLLIDWDLVGGNIQRESSLPRRVVYLASDEYYEESTTNQIFKDLNYRKYYQASIPYFEKRTKHSNEVPQAFKNEHRKRAIISILIDSYAHNISHHSLTILKWWFQQRALDLDVADKSGELEAVLPIKKWGKDLVKFLEERFPLVYNKEVIETGLKYDFARWYNMLEKREKISDFKAVRDQFFSLEEQITPLFKYLLEKGAFWSGITRDQQFGGEIHNLYEVLWDGFIQNPLYLGTIAYSEGITKLNICIRFYSGEKFPHKKDKYLRTYKLQSKDGVYLDGTFATIDVGGTPFHSLQHHFVQKGEMHDLLKQELEKCEVFFPGGIVGKHAFYTILENEIRNVKHYPMEEQAQMQKTGLNLVIGIRPGSLSARLNYDVKSIYKIGIWLGHPTRFRNEDQEEHLAAVRFTNLMKDIVTPDTYEARLGGTYQDKICSAMLFNNTFVSVEKRETARDQAYYPWVRLAFSSGPEEGVEKDFEINIRNHQEAQDRLKQETKVQIGYFKKYIHLWRGDFIFHITESKNLKVENMNRFQIINLVNSQESSRKDLLKEGAIRILEAQPMDIKPTEAYHQWLLQWLKDDYPFNIKLVQGKTEIGFIFLDQEFAEYYTQEEFFKLPEADQSEYGDFDVSKLIFDHTDSMQQSGSAEILSIRSHGILSRKFFPTVKKMEDFAHAKIEDLLLLELIEVLKTKICIFDKRIADRIPQEKRKLLQSQLSCDIFTEDKELWLELKDQEFGHYHFIILHLSFIEALENKEGKRYGEEGIVDFIEEQLAGKLSDNCILVITTGRGRTAWWRKLQNSEHAIYTTFRPVESLIEAVEKAILKEDDIELKYNLVKVLFGS